MTKVSKHLRMNAKNDFMRVTQVCYLVLLDSDIVFVLQCLNLFFQPSILVLILLQLGCELSLIHIVRGG